MLWNTIFSQKENRKHLGVCQKIKLFLATTTKNSTHWNYNCRGRQATKPLVVHCWLIFKQVLKLIYKKTWAKLSGLQIWQVGVVVFSDVKLFFALYLTEETMQNCLALKIWPVTVIFQKYSAIFIPEICSVKF